VRLQGLGEETGHLKRRAAFEGGLHQRRRAAPVAQTRCTSTSARHITVFKAPRPGRRAHLIDFT